MLNNIALLNSSNKDIMQSVLSTSMKYGENKTENTVLPKSVLEVLPGQSPVDGSAVQLI